jgi:CRP/FNR family cyclic AMP-dependent transcriptional regulator
MNLSIHDLEFNFPAIEIKEIAFRKGEYLFKEGEPEDGVLIIEKGTVRILKNRWVLWIANAKELIGVSSFFAEGEHYTFSAKAAEDCRILKISHAQFQQMIEENALFAKAVIEMMCDRITHTNDRLKSVMTRSSRYRLISELIKISVQSKNLTIMYNPDELSELIGISKRLIRAILTELEKKTVLKRSKHSIVINDLRGLEIIADKAW